MKPSSGSADRVYSRAGVSELAEVANIPLSEAEGAVRRYLGIVFDIGHQSVGFENITDFLNKIVGAGIPIFKLQEASSLWVEELAHDKIEALRRFTDTIYLSQTSPQAKRHNHQVLEPWRSARRIRGKSGIPVKCAHVSTLPVFLEELGPFRTTRFGVQEALAMHRATRFRITWKSKRTHGMFCPPELKTGDIIEYVSRELEFVRNELMG